MEHKCDVCDKTKPENEMYTVWSYDGYKLCNDCEEQLENKTGYCSVACRITGSCDESC